MKRLLLALLLLPSLAASALAQAPSTMSYQGVLTDNAGNLVPDGDYALTFRIYDVAAAGAALWTEAIAVVPVQKGGVGVTLGLITPINLAFDQKYYLGVQVGADPELAPRVELASSPYAMSLRLPFSQTASNAAPLLSVRNSGAGAALRAEGRLDVGSTTVSGDFRLFRNGSASEVVQAYTSLHGGNIDVSDETGIVQGGLQTDASGSGGYLTAYRSATQQGFTVDGNYLATNEPRVSVFGSARSAVFDMGASGDLAVTLPTGSISSLEQSNEPGVASAQDPSFALAGGTETMLVRTITCPAAGYVLALGSLSARVVHAGGTASTGTFGVSDVAGSFSDQVQVAVPAVLPSGNYTVPATIHGLFSVSAGTNTFYLSGQAVGGAWNAFSARLTLVYLPTAYGAVTSSEPQSVTSGGDDRASAPSRAISSADVLAEQAEALRIHQARLESEMAEMRTRFEQLQSEMAGAAAQQATVARSAERPAGAAPGATGDRK